MNPIKFRVWQCRDWCCVSKPHGGKWWNVSIAPGNYDSVPNWPAAMAMVRTGKLPWSL
jgi:hypothetical protein